MHFLEEMDRIENKNQGEMHFIDSVDVIPQKERRLVMPDGIEEINREQKDKTLHMVRR